MKTIQHLPRTLAAVWALAGMTAFSTAAPGASVWQTGDFQWQVGDPLVAPAVRPGDPCHSIKDPSVVRYEGRWHLFCTIRSQHRTHQIEYLSFADWAQADAAPRHILQISPGYFCAPQVFYFTPHRQWYLICQIHDHTRTPQLQPAYSTSLNLADPSAWTKPTLLFTEPPENVKMWIDFWVICDAAHAHLFFTSLNGQMWRAQTTLRDFPRGWSQPEVVLRGDIFEASHTYCLKGLNQYVTVVEAQGEGGRRYQKAYLASRVDGAWRPLAASSEKPFASLVNVQPLRGKWTDSFSHGELVRAGYDERLVIEPDRLQFLFQGVSDRARKGKSYGEIPWRLGLLEARPASDPP
jgi:hypothetical protein